MSDETPNAPRPAEKIVDEDWKRQVAAERERIRAEESSSAGPARPGRPGRVPEGARAPGAAPSPPPPPPRPRRSSHAGTPPAAPASPSSPPRGRERPEPREATVFLRFVSTLAAQAMMALGAIPNPMDGRRMFDRAGASYLIDVLGELQEKTRGNLTEEEDATLAEALYGLRMAYVERTGGEAPGGGGGEGGPGEAAGDEPPEEA